MCLLKRGLTPLEMAVESLYPTLEGIYSQSPAVVKVFMKAKEKWEERNKVRHLEDDRCAPYVLIGHACVR